MSTSPLSPTRSRPNIPPSTLSEQSPYDQPPLASPGGGQISKAAFFRARSPATVGSNGGSGWTNGGKDQGKLKSFHSNSSSERDVDRRSKEVSEYQGQAHKTQERGLEIPPVQTNHDHVPERADNDTERTQRHLYTDAPSATVSTRTHSRKQSGTSNNIYALPSRSQEDMYQTSPDVTLGHSPHTMEKGQFVASGREGGVRGKREDSVVQADNPRASNGMGHQVMATKSINGHSSGHKRASSRSGQTQASNLSYTSGSIGHASIRNIAATTTYVHNDANDAQGSMSSKSTYSHRKQPSQSSVHSTSARGYSNSPAGSFPSSLSTSPPIVSPDTPSKSASPTSPSVEATMYSAQANSPSNHTGATSPSYLEGDGSSDQQHMLLSLLAGQAVIDCSSMRVGGWEEVDTWKNELSMLNARLDTQVSRYQREKKILTAARTLAKLNEHNKRMSKQTTESLDQAELKAAEAEKEMLVLRDREATLRRTLNEHWAGVMAWEVRRVEKVSQLAETRLAKVEQTLLKLEAKAGLQKEELRQRDSQLKRTKEQLEGREDEIRTLANRFVALEQRKDELERNAKADQHRWTIECERLEKAIEQGTNAASTWDTSKPQLARALGLERLDTVSDAVHAIKKLNTDVKRKDEEVKVMKDEVREVSMGLEAEVTRVAQERDMLRMKLEQITGSSTRSDREHQKRNEELQMTLMQHQKRVSDLETELSKARGAVQDADAANKARVASPDPQQTRLIEQLRKELDMRDVVLGDLWTILPSAKGRESTGLVELSTGNLKEHVASPSVDLNLESLKALFMSSSDSEPYRGIQPLNEKVRRLLEDGKIVVERAIRAGKERELLKSNASRAQKLVEDSQKNLATYQNQVDMLETRLKSTKKSSGDANGGVRELQELHKTIDILQDNKKALERNAVEQANTCERLSEANEKLSGQTLALAQAAEQEKRILQNRYDQEITGLYQELKKVQEEMEERGGREQEQRLQLLDEMNTIQSHNANLRAQLRK